MSPPRASSAVPAIDGSERVQGPTPVDEVEERLRGWIARVEPSANVSIGAPTDAAPGFGASLHLVQLAPNPQPRGVLRPPLQLRLCYLVTTWGQEPGQADRLLIDLALDAMAQTDFGVDFAPPPAEFWMALKVLPRPSFSIRLPVSRLRPSRVATRVRYPLVISPGHSVAIAGVVLGPQETPIAEASVEVVGTDNATRTDRLGQFAFAAVPGSPVVVQLRVRAKGIELVLPVPADAARAGAMSIHLDLAETEHARISDS